LTSSHSCKIFVVEQLWQNIENQDLQIQSSVLEAMQQDTEKVIERAMQWFLGRNNKIPARFYIKGIAELKTLPPSFISKEGSQLIEKQVDALIKQNVPTDLAHSVIILDVLYLCLDVVWLHKQTDSSLKECALIFFNLMVTLDLFWLREKIASLPEKTVWKSLARRKTNDEFNSVCRLLSVTALKQTGKTMQDKIENWFTCFDKPIARYRKLLSLVRSDEELELEKITVLLKELRDVCS
jgi:glutamate dehydrogenase